MQDCSSRRFRGIDPENPAKPHWLFQRFLREDSAWSWPAWVLFCCASVICSAQAVPHLVHPDFRWGWDPSVYYGIIGLSGALTGLVVAQYRFPGLLAGAIAGSGSLLTAVLVLEGVNSFSRIVFAIAIVIGLLPGVAVYCVLHVVIDRLSMKRLEQAETAGTGGGFE